MEQYLLTVADKDKEEALQLAKRFANIGYHINCNKWNGATLKKLELQLKVC